MAKNSRPDKGRTRLHEIVSKGNPLTIVAVVLAVLFAVALWKVPQLQVRYAKDVQAKDRFNSENEARKTLATILGGIVVLAGAYFTWQNVQLAKEGQVTDRFAKAIEQVGAVDGSGNKKLEVRLGGIYALERIANQSERDYWPIMEVLTAYVRENTPYKPQESIDYSQAAPVTAAPVTAAPVTRPLPIDIQAILTVISRRDRKYEPKGKFLDLRGADLEEAILSPADLVNVNFRGTNLRKADLHGAVLDDANLSGANLSGADLIGANLPGADLSKADLGRANASGANLRNAKIIWAQVGATNFSGADLRNAKIEGNFAANLRNANLSGADLSKGYVNGADLSGANLSGANLGGASIPGVGDLVGTGIYRARLAGANVHGANFTRARVSDTDLREVRGLTQEQVDVATGNSGTQLPDNLHRPESWEKN